MVALTTMAGLSEEFSRSCTTMADHAKEFNRRCTTMDDLPKDLIDEILIRLPFKSLLRLRTVSRKWYSLISRDNEFAKRHLKQSYSPSKTIFFDLLDPSDEAILFLSSDVDTHKFNFPGIIPKPRLVFGSANGLICVAPLYGKCCFLWNPFIGQCKFISLTEYFSSCKLSGFCYDSYSDDYKIVGVWTSYFTVFSLKNNSRTKTDHSISFRYFPTTPIFSNGALHWCIGSNIVAFDSANDQLFYMEVPKVNRSTPKFCSRSSDEMLLDYQGSLCFFDGWSFWVMKEYGVTDSWAKLDKEHVKLPAWFFSVVRRKSELVKYVGFLHTESLILPNILVPN